MNFDELEKMRGAEFGTEKLTDISGIKIDKSRPLDRRLEDFCAAAGNPYLFKIGDTGVRLRFSPGGREFTSAMARAVELSNNYLH